MSQFQTQNFQGTVVLKDWYRDPIHGRQVLGIMGRVSIIQAKDMIGFDPGHSEANWIARVDGPSTSYNFPGCQVRCVVDHPNVFEPASSAVEIARAT